MQYVIKPDGYQEFRKTVSVKSIAAILSAFLFLLSIRYVKGDMQFPNLQHTAVLFIIVVILFLALAKMGETGERQKFESYTLSFDGQLLTRERDDLPAFSILRSEVTGITKDQKGNFTIRGQSRGDVIFVPAQIADYPKLENALNRILPVNMVFKPAITVEELLLFLVLVCSIATIQITYNKTLLVFSIVLLLLSSGYLVWKTQQNPDSRYSSKSAKWHLLFMAYPLFQTIYDKLF